MPIQHKLRRWVDRRLPGKKFTEAYVTDFCLENLELGHASLRLYYRYLMFFE